MPDDQFLDENALCALLGVSPVTTQKWRHLGRGPTYVKLGPARRSPVRYRMSDVQSWLRSQTIASTDKA